MNTSKIVVSEALVRNTATNLKNLLNLAETQNFPCANIEYPSLLSILNAVAQCFGFSSVKGMSVALEGDLTSEIEYSELKAINLDSSIKKKNPEITGAQLFEVKKAIKTLFEMLIKNPLDETDEQILARMRSHQFGEIATQSISMLEFKTYRSNELLVSDIIKVATYSNILYSNHLATQGIKETSNITEQLNFNAERSEGLIGSWNNRLHTHLKKSKDAQSSNIILSHQFNENKYKAHFNPNQDFVATLTAKLRAALISKLMLSKNTCSTAELIIEHEQAHIEEKKAAATDIQDRLVKANVQAISAICGRKITTGVDSFKDFDLDAYGLLTPKFFSVLSHVYGISNKDEVQFKNLNVFYWAMQKLSISILNKGDELDQAAAKYITDVYNNFIPVISKHFTEVHNEEFKKLMKEVRIKTKIKD